MSETASRRRSPGRRPNNAGRLTDRGTPERRSAPSRARLPVVPRERATDRRDACSPTDGPERSGRRAVADSRTQHRVTTGAADRMFNAASPRIRRRTGFDTTTTAKAVAAARAAVSAASVVIWKLCQSTSARRRNAAAWKSDRASSERPSRGAVCSDCFDHHDLQPGVPRTWGCVTPTFGSADHRRRDIEPAPRARPRRARAARSRVSLPCPSVRGSEGSDTRPCP